MKFPLCELLHTFLDMMKIVLDFNNVLDRKVEKDM